MKPILLTSLIATSVIASAAQEETPETLLRHRMKVWKPEHVYECDPIAREANRQGTPVPDNPHFGICRGVNMLHFALTLEEIQKLLADGKDPNAANPEGITPLHMQAHRAAAMPSEEGIAMVQALLKGGAYPWAKTKDGQLPLDYGLRAHRSGPQLIEKKSTRP